MRFTEVPPVEDAAKPTPEAPKPSGNPEAAKYRRRASELKARVADLEAKLAAAVVERDDAVKKFQNAPGDSAKKIAELEGRIRDRAHRDAFAKLAAGKVRPDALDDAFALSGWKVEADSPDEAKMGEAITSLLASRGYLKAEEAKPPAEESASPVVERSFNLSGSNKPTPVPGAGRGPAPETTPKQAKPIYRL